MPDFVAVHEGSTNEAAKSQPVLELYAQEKYAWIGQVKGMAWVALPYLVGIDNNKLSGEYNGPPPFPWDPQN